MFLILPLVFGVILGGANAQSPLARTQIGKSKTQAVDYLLPKNLKPILYEIELEPNFKSDTFNGSVSITFLTVFTTNSVVLHVNELEIDVDSIRLLDDNENVVNSVSGTSYSNNDRHFYTITFKRELLEDSVYILVINSFRGTLNSDNAGFYLAKYVDANGVERKLATTQFEPTSARRAFPCFDEPALKAEFEVTIIRTSEYDSISNTPKVSADEISEGRFQDKFARTVVMSTYLLAFVVSDFTYVADSNHRVYGRPALIADNRADYALRVGTGVLDAISEFVNVPYTLEKMDQIGLPDGYFAAGAMENWGLVTYREALLMYANGTTGSNNQESVITIISHEFGHQWFGDLVSPSWWSYIWLNEGFATYFECYGASVVAEDMELMNQMVIKIVQYALSRDSSTATRPMNQDVGSPSDIRSLFDAVAYGKSGAVIRMVEGIISTEVFRKGLGIYLNKMQFQAAQPSDLYTSWQQALDEAGVNPLPVNEDVSSVLTTWDSNAGYPLVTVTRNYENGTVTLSQRRFLTSNPNNDDASIWYVPISYTTGKDLDFSDTSPKLWLTTRSSTVNLDRLTSDDWLIVNIQESGYYRVNYDSESWCRIINVLNSENFGQINKLNRAQLIDDSFSLAKWGVIDYEIPLNLFQYLSRETDYIPLYPFIVSLTFLDTYMSNTDLYEKFQKYIVELLDGAINSMGFDENENDRHVTKMNRVNILNWVCRYGRQDCREYALKKLREWEMDETKPISPNLQTPLTCSALAIGEQSDWNFVYQKYVSETESVVRARLLNALGCSEKGEILDRFMNIILDSNSNITSDRIFALLSILHSGNYGKNYIYNYIKHNWAAVSEGLTESEVSGIIFAVAAKFSTKEQLADLQTFIQEIDQASTYSSAISTVEGNIDWADRRLPSILNWFNDKSKMPYVKLT